MEMWDKMLLEYDKILFMPMSSGLSGACATAVACHLNGKTGRKVDVELIGGTLTIEWREEDNHVYMTGPAEFSFDGVWLREV